jgi:hypothetical protein
MGDHQSRLRRLTSMGSNLTSDPGLVLAGLVPLLLPIAAILALQLSHPDSAPGEWAYL